MNFLGEILILYLLIIEEILNLENLNFKLGLDTLLFKMYLWNVRVVIVMILKLKKFGGILDYSEEPVM
jgi:hypothetical protein